MHSYTGMQTVLPPKQAVVVGGGFIGLEMVENLVHRGLEVTLVERLNQVMPPLDPEMARLVERYMVQAWRPARVQRRRGRLRADRRWRAGSPHGFRQAAAGRYRDPGHWRAAGDGAGQDGRHRDRPARRHPRRRADAHQRPRYLRGRRRGRGQGFRHRPMVADCAGRAGQPAGPYRGRSDRRARRPLPRHAGHLDLPDLRGRDRLDRRQREAPEAAWRDRISRRSTSTRIRTQAIIQAPNTSP